MAYQISTTEGRTIELTMEQADRWDAGDREVLSEIAETLPPGDYSIYAPDGGPLLENITVAAGNQPAVRQPEE